MARLDDLLRQMKSQGASDLHMAAGSAPYMRINGEMAKLNYRSVSPETSQSLIFEILNETQRQHFEENWDLDLSYALKGVGRFRANIFMQRNGIGAAFRLIPEGIKTVKELDLPEQLVDLMDVSEGLILLTGPTGAGKTTTLAALIHSINVEQQKHIITIEDPIEFVHENHRCLINQREVAGHTKSFSGALRAALREDPDIILVGEMRDLETISLAVTAAETGHLVFATLHTNNAAQTVDRMVDVFPPGQQEQVRFQLSNNLEAVLCQQLLPKAGGPGRICAMEIMICTPAVRNLIREAKAHQITSSIQTSANIGMQTMDQCLRDLYQRGSITLEEALTRAMQPEELKKMIQTPEVPAGVRR